MATTNDEQPDVEYINLEPTSYGYAMINRALMESAAEQEPDLSDAAIEPLLDGRTERYDDDGDDWDEPLCGYCLDYAISTVDGIPTCDYHASTTDRQREMRQMKRAEREPEDDDPRCAECGVYRSEHALCMEGGFHSFTTTPVSKYDYMDQDEFGMTPQDYYDDEWGR